MATTGQQTAIGVVSATQGEVFAKNANGQMRRLAVGDSIFEGDIIVTANGSSAEITPFNGPVLNVGEQQTVAIDDQVASSASAQDSTTGAVAPLGSAEAAKVIQTVGAQDFNALLEDDAAAAGLTGGDGSDGGHNFVEVLKNVESVPTVSFDFTANAAGAAPTVSTETAVPQTSASSPATSTNTATGTPTEGGTPGEVTLAPKIHLDPIAGDDIVNAAERGGDLVTVTGKVGGDAKEGDTVTLTIGSATYSGKVAADLTFSIAVGSGDLAANSNVHASVTATDPAGNQVTVSDDRRYTVDVKAPNAPGVTITSDVNNDGILATTEISGGKVNVDVSLANTGAVAGDTLTFNGQAHVLTGTDITNGKVSYALDTVPAGQTISAVATITDAAGNTSAPGRDSAYVNAAPTIYNAAVTLSESGLPGANLDATGNDVVKQGNLSVSDADHNSLTLTLSGPAGLTSNGLPITWQSQDGGHTLVGSAGGTTIVTVTIDDNGTYTATLSGPIDHSAGGGENTNSFDITVSASDRIDTSVGKLTINVIDDIPTLAKPVTGILYSGAGTTLVGDLNLAIGADAGNAAKVTFSYSGLDSNNYIYASRVDQTGKVVGGGYLTYNDSKLHYMTGADGSFVAVDNNSVAVYKVSANPVDGHYTVTMLKTLDPAVVTSTSFGSVTAGNNGTYTFSDGTNSFSVAASGYEGGVLSTINTSANTFGVGQGQDINTGDRLHFDFSSSATGSSAAMSGIKVVAQGLGNNESFSWKAFGADGHTTVGEGTVVVSVQGQGSTQTISWTAYDAGGHTVGTGTSASTNVQISLDASKFQGGTFSSIEFGAGADTSYKLQLVAVSGDSEALNQVTNVGVTAVDSDGDATASQYLSVSFDGMHTLNGTSGADAIAGGFGNDTIAGGFGNDTITGGAGNDTLTGGLGADTFVWKLADVTASSTSTDKVTDFGTQDKLDLRDIVGHGGTLTIDNSAHTVTANYTDGTGGHSDVIQIAFDASVVNKELVQDAAGNVMIKVTG